MVDRAREAAAPPKRRVAYEIATLDALTLSEVWQWALRFHIGNRPPDEVIPDTTAPYLNRWYARRKFRTLDEECDNWILELSPFSDCSIENAYVHVFQRSDDDRALHDHPWSWVTVLLDGSYYEHLPKDHAQPAGATVRHLRQAGDIVVRDDAARPHRIELIDGQPVTTLFMTTAKSREWGFWCKRGWRHWKDFNRADANGRSTGFG